MNHMSVNYSLIQGVSRVFLFRGHDSDESLRALCLFLDHQDNIAEGICGNFSEFASDVFLDCAV